jgi:hypothetical protein
MKSSSRIALAMLTVASFLLCAAAVSTLPPAEPSEASCDVEVRRRLVSGNVEVEYRCTNQGEDCTQCGTAGTCEQVPPGTPTLPGSFYCRCEGGGTTSTDTCWALIELDAQGEPTLHCNNGTQDICECAEFCFGEPLPCCDKTDFEDIPLSGDYEKPCNCVRGTETEHN